MNCSIFQITHVSLPITRPCSAFKVLGTGSQASVLKPDFENIFIDTVGDNLTLQKDAFAELTAHYWVWKNFHASDYIGFFHYRRYFNFAKPVSHSPKILLEGSENCINLLCTQNQIDHLEQIMSFSDIVTIRNEYNENPLDIRWPSHHPRKIWLLAKVVCMSHPFYKDNGFAEFVDHNRRLTWYPMFVASRPVFENICSALFPILFEVYNQVAARPSEFDLPSKNYKYLAYLAEPLLMFIYSALRLRTFEAQVFVSEDDRIPTRLV
jgi:hypothetical protein